MRVPRKVAISGLALVAMAVGLSSSAGAAVKGRAASASPIIIGASLSLSGDFSADGQAFQKGYELWAADQNKAGGLLGHPIKLEIISDASSPAQVVTNYQKLIGSDKDPARVRAVLDAADGSRRARRGRATATRWSSGAGGGPTVFGVGPARTSSTCRSRSRTTS